MRFVVTFLVPILIIPCSLFAANKQDVRGVHLQKEGLKVIEEKCLVCHNRNRIDNAIKERRKMEQILMLMEKKGVSLSDREREVMGHFWKGQIFKEKKPAL